MSGKYWVCEIKPKTLFDQLNVRGIKNENSYQYIPEDLANLDLFQKEFISPDTHLHCVCVCVSQNKGISFQVYLGKNKYINFNPSLTKLTRKIIPKLFTFGSIVFYCRVKVFESTLI